MDFNRQISRRLHEEHEATLALWNRFEQAVAARARAWPPHPNNLQLIMLHFVCQILYYISR